MLWPNAAIPICLRQGEGVKSWVPVSDQVSSKEGVANLWSAIAFIIMYIIIYTLLYIIIYNIYGEITNLV